MKMNKHYNELKASYLFVDIAHKVAAYQEAHPEKEIIRLGIGDVTQPLAKCVVKAMHDAADEMGTKEGFHGYGPEQGYPFLKQAIQGYYAGRGTKIAEDEIFISDGAKSDLANVLGLFDVDNTARAYVLLQKAGWITLDSSVDLAVVTQDDIVENPHNIEFTEMASLNIPSALQDFDYAVITGSIVYNAGIDASTALLTEDVLPQLILQVVVKKDNADTDWAKAIVAAYHSDEFKKYMDENNNGLWYIPDELK